MLKAFTLKKTQYLIIFFYYGHKLRVTLTNIELKI